jgi:uncharacterized protein YecE (DUF72 family)
MPSAERPDIRRHARIGTAGWSIGREAGPYFPAEGSSLERYSQLFSATEINSSFHRPHRPATWLRWRDSVPAGFRFSVKLPKTISHERKLLDCGELLDNFLEQAEILRDKLSVLLLQLPPQARIRAGRCGAVPGRALKASAFPYRR